MNETDTIEFAEIRNYRFEDYFQKYQHNEKVLSEEERKDFINVLDEVIHQYSDGQSMVIEHLDHCEGGGNKFNNAYRTVLSVYLFVISTSIECFIIIKYFLLADTDIDKRFMRGKMKIILNEGFKKLYGYEEKTYKKSEWMNLSQVIEYLPLSFQLEYKKLSYLLDKHSKSSNWWQKERELETHFSDSVKLYKSRCEKIEESKVMMEVMMLFSTLYAVQLFTTKLQTYFNEIILQNYKN